MSQQESKCPVNADAGRSSTFFYNDDPKNGMCSKCHPCKLGIYDAIKILEAIQAGKGGKSTLRSLKRIAVDVKDGGMCKKGKDHADILAAFLAPAEDDLERHIKGVCTYHECKPLVRYEIDADEVHDVRQVPRGLSGLRHRGAENATRARPGSRLTASGSNAAPIAANASRSARRTPLSS